MKIQRYFLCAMISISLNVSSWIAAARFINQTGYAIEHLILMSSTPQVRILMPKGEILFNKKSLEFPLNDLPKSAGSYYTLMLELLNPSDTGTKISLMGDIQFKTGYDNLELTLKMIKSETNKEIATILTTKSGGKVLDANLLIPGSYPVKYKIKDLREPSDPNKQPSKKFHY